MKHALTLILALSLPITGHAQTSTTDGTYQLAQNRTADDVVAALEYEGYLIDRVARTLLGRVQITATNELHQRRIVVSRHTGEILSDAIVTVFEAAQDSDPNKSRLNISGSVTIGVNVD